MPVYDGELVADPIEGGLPVRMELGMFGGRGVPVPWTENVRCENDD